MIEKKKILEREVEFERKGIENYILYHVLLHSGMPYL